MSVSRPARCLVFRSKTVSTSSQHQCSRAFSALPALYERRRPKYASIKAKEMSLIRDKAQTEKAGLVAKALPYYKEEETAALAAHYTPQQLQVIREAETAVDRKDLFDQGAPRLDPGRLPYLDDMSNIRPVIDKKVKVKSTIPENARFMSVKEKAADMSGWWAQKVHEGQLDMVKANAELAKQGPDSEGKTKKLSEADMLEMSRPNRLDFMQYMEQSTSTTGGGVRGSSVIAPGLPRIKEVADAYGKDEIADPRDPDGRYNRLRKQTGMTLEEILNFKVKILVSHSVTNQTRLGKIQSSYILAIAGDRNGKLGLGEGKAVELEEAFDKARMAAIRNMKPLPRYEQRTIFGEVEGKVCASEVKLMSRPPGFGLRCHHNIFEMCRAAGIHDLAARVPRSRNKMNTIKATYEALMSQRIPDQVARGRGKKLVDVRKVYYGGEQPYPAVNRAEREERSDTRRDTVQA